jgi:hypothetical protein
VSDADAPGPDAFLQFAAEIADGERWKVIRADGWEDMQVRLAEAMEELPVRRRQALIMLLFALVEQFVTPEDVRDWTAAHDLSGDDGVEALIAWLRQARAQGD